MFIHIVMFKLQENAGGRTRAENAALIKERFEEIANMLDDVHRFEVGINVIPGDEAADLVLYSEFANRSAYDVYAEHPAHKDVVAFIKTVRTERRVIDYER